MIETLNPSSDAFWTAITIHLSHTLTFTEKHSRRCQSKRYLWSAGARWRPSTAAASWCTSTAGAGSCCRRRPWGRCRTSPGCTSRWTWQAAASRPPSSCPSRICPPRACRASLRGGDYQAAFHPRIKLLVVVVVVFFGLVTTDPRDGSECQNGG